jgi:hypothetical protein
LAITAASRLGVRILLAGEPPANTVRDWLTWVLPKDLPLVVTYARLHPEAVEFGDQARDGGHLIELPATDPLLIEVSWQDGMSGGVRVVTLTPGQQQLVSVGSGDVTLLTGRGRRYTLCEGSTMNRTRRSEHSPESYPRIFISHRHKEEDVAKALVNLLEAAFHIEKGDIRCTSVQPYRLPAGARTPDRLRAEIRHARVVLGILTPDTKESSYVLFELGASWGQNIPCFPFLAKGATSADIPSPIGDLHSLQLADESDCHQLINELPHVVGLRRREGFEAQIAEKISDLVQRARRADPLGIKITKPAYGQAISGRDFSVEGRFDKTPPGGTFRVFIRNLDGTRIWPQKRVVFHPETHTWEAKATLLDHPANEAYILIAEIGDMGKLLYDYYTEVGEAKDVWIPLSKFTPDTTIYDEVFVRNSMTSRGIP